MPILALLLAGLLIGLLGAGAYGVSIDEQIQQTYADQVIDVYEGVRSPRDTFNETMGYYGPAFSVISKMGAQLLAAVIPPWQEFQAHHFINYLSFLMAVFFIYKLSLRISGRTAAFLTAALFFIQPLLFGHAFINSKDIPFMAFFLASVSTGFHAVDALRQPVKPGNYGRLVSFSLRHFLNKRWKLAAMGFVILLLLDLLFFNQLRGLALDRIAAAYEGRAGRLLQDLFRRTAGDAWKTPLDAYQQKVSGFFSLIRWGLIYLLYTAGAYVSLKLLLGWRFARGEWLCLLAVSPVLGLTISNRVFGVFAGGLVGLYAVLRMREKSILPLAFYGINAALIAYLTWPYLWGSPLMTLYESVALMSSFSWDGAILYRGEIITASSRPWHYVPWLLMIQLTLPAVFLAAAGVLRSMLSPALREHRLKLLIVFAWFAVPLAGSFLPSSRLYDNTRQLLFIVPPLFVFASTALSWLLDRLEGWLWKAGMVVVLLLFGTPALFTLHPYQYIYYNELARGVEGAYGSYELDYWKTSVRELMEYVNREAPEGALIGYTSQQHLVDFYRRDDLQPVEVDRRGKCDASVGISVISLRSGDFLGDVLPGEECGEIVYRVERMNAPLGYVIEHTQ